MKVVAYFGGAPNPTRMNHKLDILHDIIDGINKVGDTGIKHYNRSIIDCDVGVIQGFVHQQSERVPHLNFRRDVLASTTPTFIADSNLFNYRTGKEHPSMYHRWSIDGVFPTTGSYFDYNIKTRRWDQICNDLNLSLRPYRKTGNHILLCCQRNGGWSMKGLSVPDWIVTTVRKIKKYTDRPIVIRPHPGDKHAYRNIRMIKHQLKTKHRISTNRNIVTDLDNAWATVTYNSSPSVVSAIEGVPVFITDQEPKASQAYEVANIDLAKLEAPIEYDRLEWVQKLSMCHWNKNELQTGKAWKHFRDGI